MIANRIGIDEVVAENGTLRLMKNQVWAYDSLPHMLIGGTGGEDLFPPHHYRSTIEVRCRIVYPRSQKCRFS